MNVIRKGLFGLFILLNTHLFAQQFKASVPAIEGASVDVPMQMPQLQAPRAVSGGQYQRVTVSGGSYSYSAAGGGGLSTGSSRIPRRGAGGSGGALGGGSAVGGGVAAGSTPLYAIGATGVSAPASIDEGKRKVAPGGGGTGIIPVPLGEMPWVLMLGLLAAFVAYKRCRVKE